jgi:CBS domain-containing protein
MRTNIIALPAHLSAIDLLQHMHPNNDQRGQRLYPVVEDTGRLIGVVTRTILQEFLTQRSNGDSCRVAELATASPVVAYPDEPLRVVVYRMAQTGLTRLPVVDRTASRTLVGMISLRDLLQARVHNLEAEQRRERILFTRLAFPKGPGAGSGIRKKDIRCTDTF